MNKTWVLAKTSFRELVRERVFWLVAGLAIFLLCLSLLLGELSFDERERLLWDFGLAAAEIGALAMALFSGSYLIPREVERQTCLLILAKPVSRFQFLLGKWLGSAAVIA